jgi:Nif-specific regulatory protein
VENLPSMDPARARLESLIEINQLMMGTVEPSDLVALIINSARRLFAAEACSIAVMDEGANELVFAYSDGGAEVGKIRMKPGQGIVGWVAQTGEPVVCRDTTKDSRWYRGVDAKTGFHTQSLMCAPLRQRGALIGAIEVLNFSEPEKLTDEDLRLLTVFGGLAGTAIDRAKLFATASKANAAFQEMVQDRYQLIHGSSSAMQKAVDLGKTVASSNATVLLLGESGTGKEVLARAIHQWSSRSNGSFTAVNCVALNPDLMESELFGHEKGAFTGAIARKIGRFELAEGGTLFLDEIGELTTNLQTKLLRVLQEREFERVGGTRRIQADVRVIAATNRDLAAEIRAGRFREDLYYRLNVVAITMPPLREHLEDIPALADHFISRFSREVKKPVLRIDPRTMECLKAYSWPGNVRELQNVIERSVVLCSGPILLPEELPAEISGGIPRESTSSPGSETSVEVVPLAEALERCRRDLVKKALERSGGNQTDAAELLGLQRSNLSRLMKILGLR